MKSILHKEMSFYVLPTIKVDSHQAKLGDDVDVCVLKFETTNKDVAKDLVLYIETGKKYVLDADYSPSKNTNGHYDVFVELERNQSLPENIITLARDIEQTTGMLPWSFTFHKGENSYKLTQENLKNQIPTNPNEYEFLTNDEIDEDVKNFFESAEVKNITRDGKTLTLSKAFSKHIFEIKSVNSHSINGVYKIDNSSESQSSYINSWLGAGFRVVKLDDDFKVSKNNKTIIIKAKDF